MDNDNGKGYGCFVMAVSGLALLIALTALRRWDVPLWALKTSDFNVVDIFSILVTVLIGWQVFNAIENHKTLRRMDRLQSQFERSNRLLELQDQRAMDLLEAFAQDRMGDNENELSAKYMCYLNAIHLFIKANVPGANLNLTEAEIKLEQTLIDIENSKNAHSRGVFVSHIPTYENVFRKIMTIIHQRQDDLEALHTRIIRLRDERRRVCESIQQSNLTNR